MFYILDDDNNPVETSFYEHFNWRKDNTPRMSVGYAENKRNNIEVSTIFLGFDHGFPGGPVLLFETAIFRDADVTIARRYSTYAEAAKGHAEIVKDFCD